MSNTTHSELTFSAQFNNGQPNGNEVFTATAGSQPNLFTFQRRDAQLIGVSGSQLLASDTAATVSSSHTGRHLLPC
jgi:hypothetical protein